MTDGKVFSFMSLTLATSWTVAHQAPLSMGFSRQEYWSALPLPFPGDLPDLGIQPTSPASPAMAVGFTSTLQNTPAAATFAS